MATIDVRIATTTSIVDSGLMNVLKSKFQAWQLAQLPVPTNIYNLNWETPNPLSLGSGAAMIAAREGKADIVMAHDRVGELIFLAERFALVRKHVFFNYFGIVGPSSGGPITGDTLATCFTQIANNSSVIYVSRGPSGRSGTWIREQQILKLLSLTLSNVGTPPTPAPPAPPYSGMMATLNYTAGLVGNGDKAYTLTDIGTWYEFQGGNNNGRLIMLTSPNDYPWDVLPRDPLASNQYVAMPVNPNACFDTAPLQPINTDGAFAFLRWLHTSSGDNNARDTINGYKIEIGTDGNNNPIEKQGFIYNACSEHFPDNKCLIKPIE